MDHRVSKLAGNDMPKLRLDAREGKWHAKRASYSGISGAGELETQAGRPLLIPCLRLQKLNLSLWPDH